MPRARIAAASHSAPRRTRPASWLTVSTRTKAASPSAISRRRAAISRSRALQSAMRPPYPLVRPRARRARRGPANLGAELGLRYDRGRSISERASAARRRGCPMGLVIFLLVVVALVALAVLTYNRLVGLTQRSAEAWSDVDVQLKRRTDLVPNLVETVKGYAGHERATFDAVVRARGAAIGAQTPEARGRAEGQLSDALRQLFAVAESYPELKASDNFQALQQSLAHI